MKLITAGGIAVTVSFLGFLAVFPFIGGPDGDPPWFRPYGFVMVAVLVLGLVMVISGLVVKLVRS